MDEVTVLTSRGLRLTKLFRANGQVEPYEDAKTFSVEARPVSGLLSLMDELRKLAGQPHRCIIRGRLREGANPRAANRRYRQRPGQPEPSFEDAPRHWLCVDVDKMPLPGSVWGDAWRQAEAVRERLPQELHDAEMVVQWSSSHGVYSNHEGRLACAHVWLWLASPLSSAAARALVQRWKDEGRPWLDPSLCQAVQPHYTATPIFEDPALAPEHIQNGLSLLTGDSLDLSEAQEEWDEALEARRQRAQTVVLTDLEGDLAIAAAILANITADVEGYDERVAVGMALHSRFEGDPRALELWDQWCARWSGYEAGICDYKWSTFTPRSGVGFGTLVGLSRKYGYEPPIPNDRIPDGPETRVDEPRGYDPGEPPEWVTESGPADGRPPGASEGAPPRSGWGPLHFKGTTDVGNRERFIEQVGADVRYVPSFKSWLVWEGGCWRPDTGQVQELAIDVARSVREEAQEAWSLGAKTEAKLLERHARRSEQAGSIGNMLRLASSHRDVVATHGRLDANPMLLGCPNGTVDLRTGELREAARDELITRQTLTPFDAQAQCPTFERFLGEVLGGDADLVEYVRRCIGYSLTGLTTEQCLFFLHGTGRNGKGTLVELLLEMLGGPASLEASAAEREERNGYAKTADFTTFLEQRNSGPRDDLAALRGARLVAASEPTEGRRLDEGFVKSITGGDAVTARFLYGQLFTFRPEFKLWLSANHRPGIRGTDHGIWRRIKLIPFDVTFTTAAEREEGREGPPVDKKLPGKLRKELPGILAWAVRACLDWQVDGLCEPSVVQRATAAYRSDMDLIGQFVADRCVVLATASAKAAALYSEYKDWSTHNGRHNVMTQTAFGNELGGRGYQKKRTSQGMVYEGLGLIV